MNSTTSNQTESTSVSERSMTTSVARNAAYMATNSPGWLRIKLMLKRGRLSRFLDVEFVNGVNQQALYFCHLGPRILQ